MFVVPTNLRVSHVLLFFTAESTSDELNDLSVLDDEEPIPTEATSTGIEKQNIAWVLKDEEFCLSENFCIYTHFCTPKAECPGN